MFTRKRLFADIETSPNIGTFWDAGWKKTIPYQNIIKERAIICICWKWEGEDVWHWLHWDKNQCDKEMLKIFISVMNEADEIVGHNGDKYDWAWVRTRALIHGLSMSPKYNTIDTLKIARSVFRFNSNTLNYIAGLLGIGNKNHTTYELWHDILLKNCKKSMITMVDYCGQDVVLLEKVWNELKNHVSPKMHYRSLYTSNKMGCPECGSDHLVISKTRSTVLGTIKREMLCRGCGKYHSRTVRVGEQ